MAYILFVRVKTDVERKELEQRMLERKQRFLEVPGLAQKVYGEEGPDGSMCGVYFFETKEALDNFRESELVKTMGAAYEVTEVRQEVYRVLYPLRPDRGPISDWNE